MKTIYLIRFYNMTLFKEGIHRFFEVGFVFRYKRLVDVKECLQEYGYPTQMLVYADNDCKRVLLSTYGDCVNLTKFNVIEITVDAFFNQKLHERLNA